jgi:PmbA protein
MLEQLLERANQAIELARTAGANDAAASASRSRKVEFRYRDGALEKVSESTSRSLSLSIYADGRYSTHTTTDLRTDRLQTFVDDAVKLTAALQPDPHRRLPDPALYAGRSDVDLELVDPKVQAITREQREAWCATMDARIREDKQVISATGYVSDTHGMSARATSNGFSGTQETTSAWLGAEATFQDEGERRPESWDWRGGRHIDALPDPDALAQNVLRLGRERLGSQKGPTRKSVMIVDPRAAGRLVSALLRPAHGRSVQQGRSWLAGQTGKKLFGEVLTLTDDPLIPRGLASRLYDGEGLAAKSMPIVENGVLKNIYVDTYYGRKAELPPTTGGRSNLIFGSGDRAGGDQDLAAILAAADDAVYVTSWLGGNSDDNTGDFSFGMRGHVVTGGKVGGPVGEMNVTGSLGDLFSRLIAVGNDPYVYSSLRAPTLVFEGVQFSGA